MKLNEYFLEEHVQSVRDQLQPIIIHWLQTQGNTQLYQPDIIMEIPAPGFLRMVILQGPLVPLEIRSLDSHDTELLEHFGIELSSSSRDLFAPYPWSDIAALRQALTGAIEKSINGIDAAFVMVHKSQPIGHFFLWGIGGNMHAQSYGLDIPELGVAIADRYQGRGLGFLAVGLLKALAHGLRKDAVELTTAITNDAGWNLYLRAGFNYTGMIRNPLEVDVVAAAGGSIQPSRYRDERQLVYLIDEAKRTDVLHYLEKKRTIFAQEG